MIYQVTKVVMTFQRVCALPGNGIFSKKNFFFFHSRHAVLLGTHARMDAMVWAGLSTTQTATRIVGACSLSQQTDIACWAACNCALSSHRHNT